LKERSTGLRAKKSSTDSAETFPETVEDGTPGGSAYLCIANATSPIGQGCDAASKQAYMSLMGMLAGNTQNITCIQVMSGICVQSDFVSIQSGVTVIRRTNPGLLSKLTGWLKKNAVYGADLTVQLMGYELAAPPDASEADAKSIFSCSKKPSVRLGKAFCHN